MLMSKSWHCVCIKESKEESQSSASIAHLLFTSRGETEPTTIGTAWDARREKKRMRKAIKALMMFLSDNQTPLARALSGLLLRPAVCQFFIRHAAAYAHFCRFHSATIANCLLEWPSKRAREREKEENIESYLASKRGARRSTEGDKKDSFMSRRRKSENKEKS
jgi:hypothetical protein